MRLSSHHSNHRSSAAAASAAAAAAASSGSILRKASSFGSTTTTVRSNKTAAPSSRIRTQNGGSHHHQHRRRARRNGIKRSHSDTDKKPTAAAAATATTTTTSTDRLPLRRRYGSSGRMSRFCNAMEFPATRFLIVKLSMYVGFVGVIGVIMTMQFYMISYRGMLSKFQDVVGLDAALLLPVSSSNGGDGGSGAHNSTMEGSAVLTDDSDGEGFRIRAQNMLNNMLNANSPDEDLPDGVNNNNSPAKMQHDQKQDGDGVFFSNISYDFRECTSPELDVPWPLEGLVRSKTSSLSCGMRSSTPFSLFFRGALWKKNIRPLIQHCERLVVFGVAFGGDFAEDLDAPHVRQLVNATDLLRRHNRCFFIFTLEEDIEKAVHAAATGKGKTSINTLRDVSVAPELTMIGHNILIPIPKEILPYKNPRRNVKLLKYMGQFMFRQTETIIWQDAKFFRDDFASKQPADYEALIDHGTCVTAMGLPVHKGTVGLENIRDGILQQGRYSPQYAHHCQAIIDALVDRPNVTDSADNLIRQCDAYLQRVYLQEGRIDSMNQGLIDSAFIIWNQKSQSCKDFNAALRCTIMDQIQCHSDRDQVSIPFALYTMGLAGRYAPYFGDVKIPVDRDWDPRVHDLDFVATKKSNLVDKDDGTPSETKTGDVMVRVVRSSCHWYFSRLGNCRTDLSDNKRSLAVFVAGTAKRYMFNGLVEHVIDPLANLQGHKVDYYLMLSVKQGLSYRSDEPYMRLQSYDSMFEKIKDEKDAQVITLYMYDKIRDVITHSGGNLGGIHIQPQPMKLDPPDLRKKQLDAKKERPKEDSYYRFPTLDLRPENKRKTAVSNRNLFKLYLGLQKLWEKHLITSEHYIGVHYDYVMLLHEDAFWLDDFNLDNLIASNPNADAYVLSCDKGDFPPISQEYNDFAIVIKREKAAVIGKYFTQLVNTDFDACHASVQGIAPPYTGCNSGMLFYWILQRNNITVHQVPQSLLPFERSLTLALKTGGTAVCIHKFCQSNKLPLVIPSEWRKCRDLGITA